MSVARPSPQNHPILAAGWVRWLPGVLLLLTGPIAAQDLAPGDRFRDCDVCPEMVVVPAGEFLIGSPSSEPGRRDSEGPQHRVRIPRPFAVGVFEVSFAEWDACQKDLGCVGFGGDGGWGRGDRPVIIVSWDDAQAYVGWLSRKTGGEYRLPSESEWEYAARAGTTTPYHFGQSISAQVANCCEAYLMTLPGGAFPANRFGLHDVHGNVWEWVQDCWNRSYEGAPRDGSAWTSGDCDLRVLRGGSWSNEPGNLRSAIRVGVAPGNWGNGSGFRVARTLTP